MTNKGINKKYNIFFTLFILAIVIVLIFNLFSLKKFSPRSKEVTRVYFVDNISRAHEKIINQFNEKYSGKIEIVPINLPFTKFTTNERKELIARSLRSKGSRIDIFAVDLIWVPRFAKWAEPLSRYFSQKDLSKILPYALSTCYYENKLVGIPLYLDIGVMFYRSDIIHEYPDYLELDKKLKNSITWEEFIQLGIKQRKDRPFFIFQGDSYEGLICNYLEVFGGNDGRLVVNNNLQINSVEAKQSCQLMVDLIWKYNLSPELVTCFNENETYYYTLENDIPFFRGWASAKKNISINTVDSNKVKYLEIAAIPHFEGHKPSSVFGGWNLMVSKNSSKKREALEFLKYILSEEAQKTLFETSGLLPILTRIYCDETLIESYPYLPYLVSLMERGIHRPFLLDYTKISDILSYHINRALKKELSVKDALHQAAAMIESKRVFVR